MGNASDEENKTRIGTLATRRESSSNSASGKDDGGDVELWHVSLRHARYLLLSSGTYSSSCTSLPNPSSFPICAQIERVTHFRCANSPVVHALRSFTSPSRKRGHNPCTELLEFFSIALSSTLALPLKISSTKTASLKNPVRVRQKKWVRGYREIRVFRERQVLR